MVDMSVVKIERVLSVDPNVQIKERSEKCSFYRNVFCFNQGELAQYSVLASLKHKKIREAFSKESRDKNELNELIEDLDNYLNTEFENVCIVNFSFLHKHFTNRKGHKVRICIKANGGGSTIIDLFRDRERKNRTYGAIDYKIEGNHGFQSVYENGSSFLCNNIPHCAKVGNYINPRLDSRSARNYKSNFIRDQFYKYAKKPDHQWMACWFPTVKNGKVITNPRPEECYKSTLIIPMTLVNNKLNGDFRNHFHINSDDIGRSIYGYLCFDNQSVGYFNNQEDENIGYFFADILSLYLIINMNYTEYSTTYLEVRKFLEEGGGNE